MANDYMVFNVTKDDIRVRMSAVDTEVWPTQPTRPSRRDPPMGDLLSPFTRSGMGPMSRLVKQSYDDFDARNGTNVPLPKKK